MIRLNATFIRLKIFPLVIEIMLPIALIKAKTIRAILAQLCLFMSPVATKKVKIASTRNVVPSKIDAVVEEKFIEEKSGIFLSKFLKANEIIAIPM